MDVKSFAKFIGNKKTIILDVRTPQEFSWGHIKGSVNINFLSSEFKKEIEKLNRNNFYAIYCNSGSRSHDALEIMKRIGFNEVIELDGGVQSWQLAGKELVN